MKKVLFVYRTPRGQVLENWKKGKGPDSLLFGANHLKRLGYKVDFFDIAYSPLNIFHPLFYLFEHSIINVTKMGFKLDQATFLYSKFSKYDVIVATGDSVGLPILLLKYMKLINKPVVFMTAGLAGALKDKTNTWVGKFYKKILPSADIFTAYSQVEIDFFEKEMRIKNKIRYIPLATDYEYFSQKSSSERTVICAVGTEIGRDYKTFFEAIKKLQIPVEIACHTDNIKGLKIPKNVKVHINIPESEVLELYQRSLLSVIPCKERYRSSGQMVVLESAAAGLPIVASGISGITSAFSFENKKHIIFSKPHDPIDLKNKISFLLNNGSMASNLGKNASIKVKEEYTTMHFAKTLAKMIDHL
ncbi:MAG: glycosyltransferase family 4 protein [Patescibacteria group bacterium]